MKPVKVELSRRDIALFKEAEKAARTGVKGKHFKKQKLLEPANILHLRRGVLNMGRAEFARNLGMSPRTIEAWEQGTKYPSAFAVKTLKYIEKNPEVVKVFAKL